jgi:hypothetical protein
MHFAPIPENDFAEYIATYYRECQSRFPAIEAIAGKWMFRDLIPAMSDFDARFIVNDGMECQDWCEMSRIIGETHLRLARRHPAWARNLEHLPGINLTWKELVDNKTYYPEYRQWTFYHSTQPGKLCQSLACLEDRQWGMEDEYFFLKKFCLYYGRYNRSIDRAVNMGVHENKYALHSRIMHYFLPPLQSAMMVINRDIIAGKFEVLEWASLYFKSIQGWELIWDILQANYMNEAHHTEEKLVLLEDVLENILAGVLCELRHHVTVIPESAGLDMKLWKSALNSVPINPAMKIFDSSKFCRLMKGRLYFYGNAPKCFDPTWPIQNEFERMNSNYLQVPFLTFAEVCLGRKMATCHEVFEEMKKAGLINRRQHELLLRFDKLTSDVPGDAEAKTRSLQVADIFDGVFEVLHHITSLADAKTCNAPEAHNMPNAVKDILIVSK